MNANLAAPGPVGATERVPVVWRNRTVHIEYQWIAPERCDAPFVVFLHEGLGSVAMWKDFPRQLCDAGGLRGLVFSRPAYGRSTPRDADEVWGPDFMHQQAHEVVPAFLDALGVQEAAWLFGHSDGASIALLMAARASNDQLRQEVEQRRALQEALRIQASIDPLTGLNNRREYEKLFSREMARARREGRAMSLVMLDLDHFKHINDDHGHAAGDEVLRCVAQLCRENFREVDIAGRLGGEEFVVLMPHTALREAGEVARRFLQVLSDTEIAFEGLRLRVQATAGVAELQAHEDHLETLLQRADHALYAGKQTGRNRVMLALPDGQVQHYQGGAMAPKEPGV